MDPLLIWQVIDLHSTSKKKKKEAFSSTQTQKKKKKIKSNQFFILHKKMA